MFQVSSSLLRDKVNFVTRDKDMNMQIIIIKKGRKLQEVNDLKIIIYLRSVGTYLISGTLWVVFNNELSIRREVSNKRFLRSSLAVSFQHTH